ncbi:NUDIX domain-containing protein [Streptomyces sp. NPDC050658]|uniref:NUDIX domain-containing protein n=1 Tax=unclassified Streptomyces TaxID=2593676 RepID=UPI003413072F
MAIKIIDQAGEEIGCIEKQYLVPLGLRHQIARVIVYARKSGTVLLQQRSQADDSCPGLWDTSASGHVDGHEVLVHAAIRELKEELSFDAGEDALDYLGSFDTSVELGEGRLERETHIYRLGVEEEINVSVADTDEVKQTAWINLEQPTPDIELTKGAAQALQLFKCWHDHDHLMRGTR